MNSLAIARISAPSPYPGITSINELTIIAEAGDLQRFSLKLCGLRLWHIHQKKRALPTPSPCGRHRNRLGRESMKFTALRLPFPFVPRTLDVDGEPRTAPCSPRSPRLSVCPSSRSVGNGTEQCSYLSV